MLSRLFYALFLPPEKLFKVTLRASLYSSQAISPLRLQITHFLYWNDYSNIRPKPLPE